MSSFGLGRRKSHGVTLDDIFERGMKGSDLKFGSILQLSIFLPYFVFYLFLSTILSAFFRGGRSIWWTFLAIYTLSRLLIGFALVVTFRFIQAIADRLMSLCDCLFVIRSKKESDLLHELQTNCKSYGEFEKIGNDLDNISSSIQKWKNTSVGCDDFDYELLELQLKTMKEIKKENNINKLMQAISHVFRRTFCSLHNSNLYNTYCYIGTKNIIENYYHCLTQCVELIANINTNKKKQNKKHNNNNNNNNNHHYNHNVSIQDRIEYFYRCKRSLGRTALCLSGGGSLSMAHCGVIRVLIENDCLPKVISGTSGGAILAGYLAVLTHDEVKNNLDEHFSYKIANQYGTRFLPTFFEQLFGAYRDRVLMPDSAYFINSIKKYVGNFTFQEAWIKTGRHVNISVSYSTKNKGNKNHAHHILLNHITSPDVYIWSAITASCALPGLMKPQQLWAKPNGDKKSNDDDDNEGNDGNLEYEHMIPYYPDGIQWVDGSLQADIPIQLLQELFRVNYTIVSQVNPHVTPFLVTPHSRANSFGLKVLEMLDDMGLLSLSIQHHVLYYSDLFYIIYIYTASRTVNHQLDRLVKLKAIPAVYGHNFDKFALQNFTGDITIVPRIPLNLRFKILSHPTDKDMVQYIEIGEKATWTHLQHIHYVLKIEKLIDSTIQSLKKELILNKKRIYIDDNNNNHQTPPLLIDKKPNSSYYLKQ